MLTADEFAQYLRDALNHLYEPSRLGRNPILALLGIEPSVGAPIALRRILKRAIESLKPASEVPASSPQWRTYEVLSYRYIQQFTQPEVADQMGLSVRHLRREQEAALERLTTLLWSEFRLSEEVTAADRQAGAPTDAAWGVAPSVNDELAWLKESVEEQRAHVAQVLPTVMDVVQGLASEHGVNMGLGGLDSLPELAVHPMALEQMLLSLLSVAMHRVPGGELIISAKARRHDVQIQLRGTAPRRGPRLPSDDDRGSLDMALRLAKMYGGDVAFPDTGDVLAIDLLLPSLEQASVLVIDDNEDTLHLFARYVSGTRYRVVGARDPEEAIAQIRELGPHMIVLDVMMPKVDGWALLRRLAKDPAAENIPILVCTVLAQRELALSLGASGYARKPISRTAFLESLDSLSRAREIGSA